MHKERIMYSYDVVAENYDSFYGSSECVEEDKELVALIIRNLRRNVLDIGSGTGWLLDNMAIAPAQYQGVDVSEKMVEVARKKHVVHSFTHGTVFNLSAKHGTIMAIYGVFSYLLIDEVRKLRDLSSMDTKILLMSYKPGYQSMIMKDKNIPAVHFDPYEWSEKVREITQAFMGVREVEMFNKYWVLTNFA